jgi:hypothetical protein
LNVATENRPSRRDAFAAYDHGRKASQAPAMAAGVTDRLWEVADMVAVLEAWENQAAT